jgi:hypothetical protein
VVWKGGRPFGALFEGRHGTLLCDTDSLCCVCGTRAERHPHSCLGFVPGRLAHTHWIGSVVGPGSRSCACCRPPCDCRCCCCCPQRAVAIHNSGDRIGPGGGRQGATQVAARCARCVQLQCRGASGRCACADGRVYLCGGGCWNLYLSRLCCHVCRPYVCAGPGFPYNSTVSACDWADGSISLLLSVLPCDFPGFPVGQDCCPCDVCNQQQQLRWLLLLHLVLLAFCRRGFPCSSSSSSSSREEAETDRHQFPPGSNTMSRWRGVAVCCRAKAQAASSCRQDNALLQHVTAYVRACERACPLRICTGVLSCWRCCDSCLYAACVIGTGESERQWGIAVLT